MILAINIVIDPGTLVLLGTIFTGIMGYLVARLNKGTAAAVAAVVAVKAVEVKTEDTIVAVEKVVEVVESVKEESGKIHALVNNQMHIALYEKVEVCEELAVATKKPEHIAKAKEARRLLAEHDARQAVVNGVTRIQETQP